MRAPGVVWFKRDLRVADHPPLAEAATRGPVLALYVIEPELWQQPDSSGRHWQWLRARLQSLAAELGQLGLPLCILRGEVPEMLRQIQEETGIAALYSHEEVGNAWTYARDRRVAAWLRKEGIPWYEFPQDGVVRPLRDRDLWQTQRDRFMRAPIPPTPSTIFSAGLPRGSIDPEQLPEWPSPHLGDGLASKHLPLATPRRAQDLVSDFLVNRQRHYLRGMSSPISAQRYCSRLSPYLALGIVSSRQVVQAVTAAQRQQPGQRGLQGLQARLAWRGHFMQKLEDEPRIEFENLQHALDGLREAEFDAARFHAWARGETGFPLVDACMRFLQATGWINFRMRAMLVSFSSYALWLHWREPALHLARLFLDYEPGIHYPQVQMQAGTTGINALRIYNVTKQAQELDPEGEFIRRWVPELAQLPAPWVQQPWLLPESSAKRLGVVLGENYPFPIVSLAQATRHARGRILAARREITARQEAQQTLQRHGSRKRSSRAARAPDDGRQLDLFS
ncbi:FAD-binding domain-containing protein [Acidithiobacillus sp. AMEEHan]|uniref:FAD-binding domain-containing protein n=1 Tax=Acidithiobacillus sp. AMEEHan TaxID=2994951 RepID=UPI0027E45568|nr:FAD-binding domain-containing protein [Acidithiobacillus sp. AMEEHan]